MSIYVTTLPTLWEGNSDAPAVISNSTIADILREQRITNSWGEVDVDKLLVSIEELPNGVNQVSVYASPFDRAYMHGEWNVYGKTIPGDSPPISSIFDCDEEAVLFTAFYDRPGYWDFGVGLQDEGSL